ncbi:MAG: hypothetical protein V1704_01075 [Candidatus Vogelbacteria bacterium]
MSSRFIVKLGVVLLVLVAAFFLYRYLFVSSPAADNNPGLEAVGNGEVGQTVVDDEFIRLLERLQGVTLDATVFASPAWQSLINFRVPLVREEKGRPNPFAPVGFDFSSNTGSTTASSSPRR